MRNLARRLAVVLFLVMLPTTAALASQEAPQLWAIGNGQIIANILTASKLFLAQAGFMQLIFIVSLIGFVWIAFTTTIGSVKPQQIFMYFIAIVLISTVTFRAKMNVTVHDSVNQYTEVVTGVPLVIALPATFVSQAGQFMLAKVESLFTYPNLSTSASSPLMMSNSGQFDLIGQMIADGNKVQILDSNIRGSMHSYVQDCVVPWMYKGFITPDQVTHSKNLWKTIYVPSRTMLTVFYSKVTPNGIIVPCGSARPYDGSWPAVGRTVASVLNSPAGNPEDESSEQTANRLASANVGAHELIALQMEQYAPQLVGQGFQGFQYTNAVTFFDGAYASAYQFLAGEGGPSSTQNILRNNAIINTYSSVANESISSLGSQNNSLIYNLNQAQAISSQRTGWQIAAAVFQQTMGYLYTVMQAFVLAVIPMSVVAFFIPGFGMKLAATLIKMMIWLALWIPALGIVNYIVAGYLEQAIGPTLAFGITMSSIGAISQQTQTAMLAASMFGISVPLIMWGLVSTGSFALTQFLSEGAGSVQARTAAQNVATESYSAQQFTAQNRTNRNVDVASSYQSGSKTPTYFENDGVANITEQAGGVGSSIGGQVQSAQKTLATEDSKTITASSIQSLAHQLQEAHGDVHSAGVQTGIDNFMRWVQGHTGRGSDATKASSDFRKGFETSLSTQAGRGLGVTSRATKQNTYGLSGSLSASLFGNGVTATTTHQGSDRQDESGTSTRQLTDGVTSKGSSAQGAGTGEDASISHEKQIQNAVASAAHATRGEISSATYQRAMNYATTDSYTTQFSRRESASGSASYNAPQSLSQVANTSTQVQQRRDAVDSRIASGASNISAGGEAVQSSVNSHVDSGVASLNNTIDEMQNQAHSRMAAGSSRLDQLDSQFADLHKQTGETEALQEAYGKLTVLNHQLENHEITTQAAADKATQWISVVRDHAPHFKGHEGIETHFNEVTHEQAMHLIGLARSDISSAINSNLDHVHGRMKEIKREIGR